MCLEKSKYFPGKMEMFWEICLEKSIFFTRIHDPQISNQIEASDVYIYI